MAVTYAGGVVLGADSRTSTGSYVANRATDKVTRIADSIFLCRSGSAADTQALAAAVATHLSQLAVQLGRPPSVHQAARVLARMAYANKDALQAGMIVAGVDAKDGGVVFALPLGGTLLPVPYAVGGSGSAYITGLCDKHWRPTAARAAASAPSPSARTAAWSAGLCRGTRCRPRLGSCRLGRARRWRRGGDERSTFVFCFQIQSTHPTPTPLQSSSSLGTSRRLFPSASA